ncbi:LysR family transcriptional regulator [Duganella sp. Root1480D1]|uniref:LysR substrate-binding domain-containing protein n=1 Tax=Duganella sp. Root1480D1 TaxID=1736471 RepID=UPI00070C7A83|nr:LysR family transcriptional regulator [Duganella sp. Root1480D1]KQZ43243.1 LysR family transcriptional regulator [Duganella sp. Root1480D1]
MAFDRLEAMRAFCRIVEVGSFVGAAEALGVPKTTISGQIQGLEAHLGMKLLHRTTRRVSPTTDGAAYYEGARALLDDLDELESSRHDARGRVRVEMPSPVGTGLIIPALPDFAARYPDVQLDIGCGERVVDLVQEGIDCALRGGPVADQDLVARRVGNMQFCLCAAPSYLASAPRLSTVEDLPAHRYLGFVFAATGRQHIQTLMRGEQRYTIEQMPAMRFNSAAAYVASGLAGLGILNIPRAEAAPHLRSGALVEVLADWHLGSMPISLVYPYARRLSARVRAFTDWATALMASDPLWR